MDKDRQKEGACLWLRSRHWKVPGAVNWSQCVNLSPVVNKYLPWSSTEAVNMEQCVHCSVTGWLQDPFSHWEWQVCSWCLLSPCNWQVKKFWRSLRVSFLCQSDDCIPQQSLPVENFTSDFMSTENFRECMNFPSVSCESYKGDSLKRSSSPLAVIISRCGGIRCGCGNTYRRL